MDFLSPAWVAAMDKALTEVTVSNPDLAARLTALDLVVEHRIDGGDDYHMCLNEKPAVRSGRSDRADVVFAQDLGTAVKIATGALGAHDAVLTGRLRVDGDVGAVRTRAATLTDLDSVFAHVRDQTEYGPETSKVPEV